MKLTKKVARKLAIVCLNSIESECLRAWPDDQEREDLIEMLTDALTGTEIP